MDLEDVSQDSGLESPTSKAESPDRHPPFMVADKEAEAGAPKVPTVTVNAMAAGDVGKFPFDSPPENYDDEPDETLSERLWGLTEMFPDCVVNAACTATSATVYGVKSFYSLSRSVLWIAASTSVILFAPVFFELEIAKIEEKQKSEQKQYLLGPSAAMIGSGATPPMPR